MIGDRIVPGPHHTGAAEEILKLIPLPSLGTRPIVTVAGESGSGKSEISFELSRLYDARGLDVFVFAQDDYFRYPPKTNDRMRREDIAHVGPHEVRLDLLDADLGRFKHAAAGDELKKPLVNFDEDRILEETIEPARFKIGIADGTYTTLLENADFRVFLDRDYHDTLADRIARKRDPIDEFSDRVLRIEHEIIKKHRARADVIVNKDFTVTATSKDQNRG